MFGVRPSSPSPEAFADRNGAVLIADEVVSLRMATGGYRWGLGVARQSDDIREDHRRRHARLVP